MTVYMSIDWHPRYPEDEECDCALALSPEQRETTLGRLGMIAGCDVRR